MFFSFRTTSNIIFDDVSSADAIINDISDDDDKSNDSKENKPVQKRRRSSSSSSSDQMKIYESFARTMQENHTAKMNLIQQLQDTKSQSELECYFTAICKTVEKFSPIEQAKIKMQISQIVGQAELDQLEHRQSQLIFCPDTRASFEISDPSAASHYSS